MKIVTLIVVIISNLSGFSQTDTIQFDLDEMSIDFKTCKCILFGTCRSYSYPVRSHWTRADSLFMSNQDSICFSLKDRGKLKIEGCKRPEGEVFGSIKFYNKKSELKKVEIWQEIYLMRENAEVSWSDGYYWAKQLVYKKNEITQEKNRSLVYDEKKGFAQKTEIIHFRNGTKKKTKIKLHYYQ